MTANYIDMTYHLYVDWLDDGAFSGIDDISSYIISYRIVQGHTDINRRIAGAGSMNVVLKNTDKRFSPGNSSSPYYNHMLDKHVVKMVAQDNIGGSWTIFYGYMRKLQVEPGVYGDRQANLECVDLMQLLQDELIGIPIQQSVTADILVKHIVNSALYAPTAQAEFYFTGNPANNDTITVDTQTYTVKTALTPATNEVLRGSSQDLTAKHLAEAINNAENAGTDYATGSVRAATLTGYAPATSGAAYDSSNRDTDQAFDDTGYSIVYDTPTGFARVGDDGLGNDIWEGVLFTPAITGTLQQLQFNLDSNYGSPTGNLTWEIYTYSGSLPGSLLYTGEFTPTPNAVNLVSVGSLALTAGQQYHLILRCTSPQTPSSGNAYDWTYANDGVSTASSYDGVTWSSYAGFNRTVTLIWNEAAIQKLAQSFQVGIAGSTFQYARLWLKKHNSPTGTLTVRIETNNSGSPSGTLVDSNATCTISESSLSSSYAWVLCSFAAQFTLAASTTYWIVISSNRVPTGTHYVQWGADASAPSYANGEMRKYNGASWAAFSPVQDAIFAFGPDLIVTATLRGAIGNTYPIAKSSSVIIISGSTPTGGVDYPITPASSIETGLRTFTIAADKWINDANTGTNGLTALEEVIDSEYGWLWTAPDGTLTFKNGDYFFRLTSTSPALTISSEENGMVGDVDQNNVFTRAVVQYTPRATLASGVIAKANAVIGPVPQITSEPIPRWNYTQPLGPASTLTVKLPFVDPTTGQPCGAQSVITPLAAGTDWTAAEFSNGTGISFTGAAFVHIQVAINGSNAEVTIYNMGSQQFYITSLQIRGVALVTYNPQNAYSEDSTLFATRGRKVKQYYAPLPSIQVFYESLANYLVSRFKNPIFRISSIGFDVQNLATIGTNIHGVVMGNVVQISDTQSSASNKRLMVIGRSISYNGPKDVHFTFNTVDIDEQFYMILDDATYGQIDSNNVLAI